MHVVNGARLEQWTALTDEQIVAQVIGGQTALFEILMRRHNERLYRAARAITRDEREAEDVMQQAYVNAYTHLRQFDGRAKFVTWLTKIAVHEAIARARKQGRYEQLEDEGNATVNIRMATPEPDPERQAFSRELGGLLEHAIDQLPDGSREVFVLRHVQGLSTAEVAATLEVSEEVVKTRLSRGRAALRRLLIERAGITAPAVFRFEQPRCNRIVEQVLAQIQ